MFVQKLLKNQNNVDGKIYVNMKDLDNDGQDDGNHVITMDVQTNTTNRQNEKSNSDKFNSKSNVTENMDQQHVISTRENIGNTISDFNSRNRKFVEPSAGQQHLQLPSPNTDMQDQLAPVVGYADEPLLSLLEACAPLVDIIQNLLVYAQLALNETPLEPTDGLTFDESAAIRLYTMEWKESHASLYTMLNHTLKQSDREALRPYFKYLKLLLTALVKIPSVSLQTVWRGVAKDLSHGFPPGTQVTWWGFSSCTTSLSVLENDTYLGSEGERTLFSVETINGRIIRAHSHFDFEDEILLLPGTYMEVHSQLSPAPGLHIIHLKQIRPMDTLLELPFEGALLYPPEKEKVPWYKHKRTICELGLIIMLCLAGIIVGAVLGTRRSPPPPICRTRSAGINADLFWSFDCGDAREDLHGLYNGTDENGASYSSPDFSGQGKTLSLDLKLSQYVRLPHSLNLGGNTSFTVSVWVLLTGANAATILSDCNTFNSICIEFVVRRVIFYVRTVNWTSGNELDRVVYNAWQVVCQSCWMHVAFTFNNQANILSIYFNGVQMQTEPLSLSSSATMETNKNAMSCIGQSSVVGQNNPFSGLIDQLSISYYVKNDSEILEEATLLCQYKFETDDVDTDSGPNDIPAYSESVYPSSPNNQTNLLLNSTDSYFQASGFTLLMSKFYEFTITFWLRPVILRSDKPNSAMAILQLVSKVQQVSSESYVCFLTLYILNITNDQCYFQLTYEQLNIFTAVDKYIVKNNTWTHIGISYSNSSQASFYINGKSFDWFSDARFGLFLYNPRLVVTIGGDYFDDTITIKPTNYASRKCFTEIPEFNFTQMYGQVDDLKVFARALTHAELATLANTKNKTI